MFTCNSPARGAYRRPWTATRLCGVGNRVMATDSAAVMPRRGEQRGDRTDRTGPVASQDRFETDDGRKDFMIVRDGKSYAGTHLIVDLYGASDIDDLAHVESTLTDCVAAAGATLLHIHLHHFTPNGGVSGVAVLAESHISIHSWPETGYAALDVFMCGNADPHRTIDVLRQAFRPERIEVSEHLRGGVS